MRTKTLWIREPYVSQILTGRKTVEVRVGYPNIQRLRPGDQLKLNDQYLVTIGRIGRYADFEELLAHEDPAAIAPELPADELLTTIRQIYAPEKEALGAIALELVLPQDEKETGRAGRYSTILFDMGYTLVYFEPPQEVIVQEALRAAGAARSAVEIQAAVEVVWGEYYRDAAETTFPATEAYDRQRQHDLTQSLLLELGLLGSAETLRVYTDAIESWFSRPGVIRPYPEVHEVLAVLQESGYRLGIVSNWSWNLRERVAQAGLDGHFDLIWASAYAGCNKPHADIFCQALARMAAPRERALYVGDSYVHDVAGARNAGVDVALLDREGVAGDVDCPVIRDLNGVFGLLGG
jgi:HAD superfamily hydrolase (TIGR01662 family)